MERKDNVEELQEHGIIAKPEKITDANRKLINSLTREEVAALISIRSKLGDGMFKRIAKKGNYPSPFSIGF